MRTDTRSVADLKFSHFGADTSDSADDLVSHNDREVWLAPL